MHKTILFILFLVSISTLIPQTSQGSMGIIGEIICETKNATGKTYKFEVKPVSGKTKWCYYTEWYIVTSGGTEDLETTGNICWNNAYVFHDCG